MSAPLVSLALPVFNGAEFLEEALDTALGQTLGDLELIICDNASTDATPRIAAAAAARDPRVRLAPAELHTGAAVNFNRALAGARGRYFKWIAHDDRLAPTYLERCLAALEAAPERVLAHSRMEEIDAAGAVVRELDLGLEGADDPRPARRFAGAISLGHGCFDVFGVIRRDALEGTGLIGPYLGSDRVLLAELALRGPFARVDEVLFQSREHPGRSIRIASDAARAAWFEPVDESGPLPEPALRPHWRRLTEMRAAIDRAGLGARDRLGCRSALAAWARTHKGALARELLGRRSRERRSA